MTTSDPSTADTPEGRPTSGVSSVLIVEDDPNFARIMTKRLQMNGFEVISASDGLQGFEHCVAHRPEIVLSDWMMPRMDGVALCRAIRETPTIAHTYFILISNKADTGERVRGFDAGADDYLVKTCDPEELYARIRVGFRIRALQRQLQMQAWVDAMTGLYNRSYFYQRADDELRRASRYGEPLVAAMIDLDDFKQINDTRGHLAGDAAIRHAAQAIQANCRETDVVCRYGGDEFGILFVRTDRGLAEQILRRIQKHLDDEPFTWEGTAQPFGLSFGLAEAERGGILDPDVLIQRADTALYEMKRARKLLVRA